MLLIEPDSSLRANRWTPLVPGARTFRTKTVSDAADEIVENTTAYPPFAIPAYGVQLVIIGTKAGLH